MWFLQHTYLLTILRKSLLQNLVAQTIAINFFSQFWGLALWFHCWFCLSLFKWLHSRGRSTGQHGPLWPDTHAWLWVLDVDSGIHFSTAFYPRDTRLASFRVWSGQHFKKAKVEATKSPKPQFLRSPLLSHSIYWSKQDTRPAHI